MKITKASVAIRQPFFHPSLVFEIRIGNEEKTISLSRDLPDDRRALDHLNVALALVDMARALEAL